MDGSTRPTVTGCTSNTMGLSNSVSDLLESVANIIQDPYEVISTEDNIHRVELIMKGPERSWMKEEERYVRS